MKIVAAMSGGVDSSVAASELLKLGHEVIGMTIKTWPKESCGKTGERQCCSLDAIQFARSTAEDLGIPFYVVNFSDEFQKIVSDYFVNEYKKGRTPNPCVYCNSKIKFGLLYKKALSIDAEAIATGHYARIIKKDGEYFLAEAVYKEKDQSYFLFDTPKEMLEHILFPLGEYTKSEVRQKAMEKGFMNAEREESQDVCFIPKGGDYREYLKEKGVTDSFLPGNIFDIKGNIIGTHKGIASYTVGQRKGLGVFSEDPLYVVSIDHKENSITVGAKEKAFKKCLKVDSINWLVRNNEISGKEIEVKIRHASKKVKAIISLNEEKSAYIEFDQPQFAPTPGQMAVFYSDEIVLGGGTIS
ncbi:MAG: tRNA 2-thiouridine(34) synthase MnmA [Candidatus Omnitrophica bacterium]|nr:tRNA 2-thiouridine(34) synthase MnmA [Candidatus Omnitrophota bacterium]